MFPTYNLLVFYYFTSLAFFIKFLQTQNKSFYIASIIFYVLACGTFEPALFLSIFFLYLEFTKDKKLKYSYTFIFISVIFLSIIIYYRFLVPYIFGPQESILFSKGGGYDGTQINFDLYKSLLTIIFQILGGLPLIFLLFKQNLNFNLIDILLFSAYGSFLYHFINKNKIKIFRNIDFKKILCFKFSNSYFCNSNWTVRKVYY